MDNYLSSQLKFWQQQKAQMDADGWEDRDGLLPFVIISREYGCGGSDIAGAVAKIFNEEYKARPVWAVYDNQIMTKLSEDLGFSNELAETLAFDTRNQLTEFFRFAFSSLPSTVNVYKQLTEIIRTLAIKGNVIIIGRGGNLITRDMRMGLQVKIIAPLEWRINNLMKKYHMKKDAAEKAINEKESNSKDVFSKVFKYDIMDPNNYHIVLNSAKLKTEEIARMIIDAMKVKGLLKV
jgi:cytidylate kinase